MTLVHKFNQVIEEMERTNSRWQELEEQRMQLLKDIAREGKKGLRESPAVALPQEQGTATDTFTTADVLQKVREAGMAAVPVGKAGPKWHSVQDSRLRGPLSTAEFIRNGLREAAQKIREEGLGKEALQKAIRKKSEEVLQEAMSATPVVPPPYMQNLPIRKKDLTDPLSRKQTRLDLTLQLLKKAMDPDELGVEDVKWLVRAMQGLQWSRDAGLAVVEGIETAEQIMQMENCDEPIAENGTGRGTPAASPRTGNFQRG